MNKLEEGKIQEGSIGWQESQKTIQLAEESVTAARKTIKRWLKDKEVNGNDNDTNYIFLRFVLDYLPKGLVGLLIAVIFLAAWGSNAAALNALASATIVDFHVRFALKPLAKEKEYILSKWYTLAWGIFCILIAQIAYNVGNSLIEAVNKLGSIFYGSILGIFLVALYFKKVGAKAVFVSALIAQAIVITIYILNEKNIVGLGYVWLTLVGALAVILFSLLLNPMLKRSALLKN
jgi:solute:Na+ symporter, SSS family